MDGWGDAIIALAILIAWSKWVTRATAHITRARAGKPWVIRNPIRALAWCWPLMLFLPGGESDPAWVSWAVLFVPPALASGLVLVERRRRRARA